MLVAQPAVVVITMCANRDPMVAVLQLVQQGSLLVHDWRLRIPQFAFHP